MKTTIYFLTQEETKRLLAAIPSKRAYAPFLIAYHEGRNLTAHGAFLGLLGSLLRVGSRTHSLKRG